MICLDLIVGRQSIVFSFILISAEIGRHRMKLNRRSENNTNSYLVYKYNSDHKNNNTNHTNNTNNNHTKNTNTEHKNNTKNKHKYHKYFSIKIT